MSTVACQADNAGVLVLSEFAGAAQSLGAGRGAHNSAVNTSVFGCSVIQCLIASSTFRVLYVLCCFCAVLFVCCSGVLALS